MKRWVSILLIISMFGMLGCGMSSTKKGGLAGAGIGGAIGAAIGKKSGNTALGAIIGAAVGGAAGAYIGNYMDKQAEEIARDLEGASVERVGEGIKITFDSGLLFDVNRASLKPASKTNLSNLATILNKYEDTDIMIEVHTDATGTEEHNLTLSRQRAQSVANHLSGLNVSVPRLTMMGYGESQPIADNESASGRAANRRVEVAIYANDKLKKAAKSKTGE